MATKIFVSGFYDIIHAGHIQFFHEARSLGDFLTVSFASEQVLWKSKRRKPSIPDEHKKVILESLCMVDKVVCGENPEPGMDFKHVFLKERPDILAVTEDDCYGDLKRELCARIGARYVVLPKTPPCSEQISTTQLVNRIKAPLSVPLRVDFAGGGLDVPGTPPRECCLDLGRVVGLFFIVLFHAAGNSVEFPLFFQRVLFCSWRRPTLWDAGKCSTGAIPRAGTFYFIWRGTVRLFWKLSSGIGFI